MEFRDDQWNDLHCANEGAASKSRLQSSLANGFLPCFPITLHQVSQPLLPLLPHLGLEFY